ncbi:Ser/Thr protein phosphatase [Tritrichomonas foetus]|uniref:protein-serine/threonine phosphatase n=1 Tax=Tritrichomonas foetus TaxID=1144522 RepID=A0A1J4K855_9EUKA|nr:Ser/Thr protein phosphatase [Tritrichomonas foetus]|eukprot:OHT05892.1 Ser/Thr protein phosphatase [Tritrichomonas foetus]
MFSKRILIQEEHRFRRTDLNNDPITLNINSDLDFILQIRNFNSKSIYSDFSLELKTFIYGSVAILASFTFQNPNGPKFDYNFTISNVYSNRSKIQYTRQKISLAKLDKDQFFHHDYLYLIVTMKSFDQNNGFAHITKTPTVKSIIEKVYKINLSEIENNNPNLISPIDFSWLSITATSLILSQPTLVYLDAPIIIVGDLRGSFSDLMQIFVKFGFPGKASYLFLGNYLDSKLTSFKTLIVLLAYKILHPNNIFLLRGSFEQQISITRPNIKNLEYFIPVLRALPFAAVVGNKIFCAHSGICPLLTDLGEIERYERPCDLTDVDPLSSLLFSDTNSNFQYYSIIGRMSFGPTALMDFSDQFGIELVVRSRQWTQNGFEFSFKTSSFVTIFSASNIQNRNKGAVMIVGKDLDYLFETFSAVQEEAVLERIRKLYRHELASNS